MSHVADTIFLLGSCREERMQERLAQLNAFIAGGTSRGALVGLVSVEDPKLPNGWYGGTKYLQAGIAIGAINYLDIPALIDFARGLDWDEDEDETAQFAIQDEQQEGFTLYPIFPVTAEERIDTDLRADRDAVHAWADAAPSAEDVADDVTVYLEWLEKRPLVTW